MKLFNFTNHNQSDHAEFFKKHGFDEVTEPMHPEIDSEMSEEEVAETVRAVLPENLKDAHILVQGMSNVCYYAVSFIHHYGGHAYFVSTERIRDVNNRFVFKPIKLTKYRNPISTSVEIPAWLLPELSNLANLKDLTVPEFILSEILVRLRGGIR